MSQREDATDRLVMLSQRLRAARVCKDDKLRAVMLRRVDRNLDVILENMSSDELAANRVAAGLKP